MKDLVYGGIVTYNPDVARLKENICAIKCQVKAVIIIDNNSDNFDMIKKLCSNEGIILIRNKKNLGIAYALNKLFKYVFEKYGKSVWVLTLDQDTVVFPNIVDTYLEYINIDAKIASVTSLRVDRNYSIDNHVTSKKYQYVRKCITSANMVYVGAWIKLNGFNNKLFIDMVDSEFCYRLTRSGYKILCVNSEEFLHELGNAFNISILGKRITVLNHNALRRYYINRNTVYLLRNYKEAHLDYSYFELLKSLLVIVLFEKDKINKISNSIMGIIDGFKMKALNS